MTCNQLIKENKKTIIKFEEFINKKTENPNDDDNYEYIESYCHTLFTQINKTIITLDIQKCTIIEKDRLLKQFEELYNLYFNILDANTNYFGWSISEGHSQDFLDYKKSFIEPNKFTSDYVIEVKNKLGIESIKKKRKEDIEDTTWFKVAVQLANGNIYNNFNNGLKLSITDLAKTFFTSTESVKIGTYRTYLSFTLSDNKNEVNRFKNIYYRTDAETDLKKVVEYCNSKGFEICQKFKDKSKEYNIYY